LRLRLPTPGLVGSPHVHSSCLGPVSFAGLLINASASLSCPGLAASSAPVSLCVAKKYKLKKKSPFGYRSPVGLSGPVIIFVTCGHMRRFGYSLPWGIMPGYNLFNCHPKCHLPPGRIYNRFFHIHKIVFSITSCINFCEWPAASRRSPLCELRASRAAVPPLSAP
jgi:hypothetical protein